MYGYGPHPCTACSPSTLASTNPLASAPPSPAPGSTQPQEDIIVEPIIQSLGLGDKALEARIVDQMSNLVSRSLTA